MNTQWLAICCFLMFGALNGFGSEKVSPNDFKALTLLDAERALNDARGAKMRSEFVDAAIASGRIDLVKMCFENVRTEVPRPVAELPDSSYKDALVIMMLRSPSVYWPSEEVLTAVSRLPPELYFTEPFISVAKKHFPNRVLVPKQLVTRVLRLELANDLERAMSRALEPSRSEDNGATRSQGNAAASSTAAIGTPKATPALAGASSVESAPQPADAIDASASYWIWIVGGVLLLAGITFVLLRKRIYSVKDSFPS